MILLLVFAIITICYYFLQLDKVRRHNTKEALKNKKKEKLEQLLKQAREEHNSKV
ncbi:hypothetical protein [Soonwooa sp.]|uniref:hypothetical protein n=1 Tax=Soonwooa sp. TaxID=1938592 RepID=UPI002608DDB0|nr:hypothetical protein [Soonwooa sp.]